MDIESAYGYGGPLSNTDDDEFLKQCFESFSNWCLEQNVVAGIHAVTSVDRKSEMGSA